MMLLVANCGIYVIKLHKYIADNGCDCNMTLTLHQNKTAEMIYDLICRLNVVYIFSAILD